MSMDFAVRLRRAREGSGLTQAELAARAGTTQSAVARLERRGANPTLDTADRLLRATGHVMSVTPIPRPAAAVDEGQLRERMRLSPAQRLALFQGSQRNLAALTAKARRVEG
jgi:transcriptional regulator with XRE-family HTH domain